MIGACGGARRRAAPRGAAPHDPRDEPRAAGRGGRDRLPRPAARAPDPTQAQAPGRCSATRPCACSSSAPAPSRPASRSTERTRPRRADLPPPRRAAARARARGGARRTRSLRRRSPSASTTASACSARAAAPRRRASRRSRRRSTGATTCSPSEQRPAAPSRRLRRRLHARGGRGGVRRRRARCGTRSPTCSRGWWRSRSSRPRSARAPRRYRLLETIRATPPPARRGGRAGGPLPAPRRMARRLVERGDGLDGLDPERGNLRAALETLLAEDPPAALGLCARCGRSGCGGSSSRRRGAGSARLSSTRRSPRRCACARCSVRPRSNTGPGGDKASVSTTRTRPSRCAGARRARVGVAGDPLLRRLEVAREDGRAAASTSRRRSPSRATTGSRRRRP